LIKRSDLFAVEGEPHAGATARRCDHRAELRTPLESLQGSIECFTRAQALDGVCEDRYLCEIRKGDVVSWTAVERHRLVRVPEEIGRVLKTAESNELFVAPERDAVN